MGGRRRGREEEEVGRFVSAGPFSWLRSLTLHAAGGDVGSLTSPTLLSRGLRKVWGGKRGREGGWWWWWKRNRKRR